MYRIKHIFDGDYGCEETGGQRKVSVTLVDDNNETKIIAVADDWLVEHNLDIGSIWPE